jgi:MtN3 and saliva related transmembrane protein
MMNMASLSSMMRRIGLLSVIMLSGCTDLEVVDTSGLLLPKFQRSYVPGFVASFGTTFAAEPELIKMLKLQSSKGMNPMMVSIMAFSERFGFINGLLIA